MSHNHLFKYYCYYFVAWAYLNLSQEVWQFRLAVPPANTAHSLFFISVCYICKSDRFCIQRSWAIWVLCEKTECKSIGRFLPNTNIILLASRRFRTYAGQVINEGERICVCKCNAHWLLSSWVCVCVCAVLIKKGGRGGRTRRRKPNKKNGKERKVNLFAYRL